MPPDKPGGLPLRIYLPIFLVVAALFLGIMALLVANGFGVVGSVFGKAATAKTTAQTPLQGSQNDVEGGPPAPVVAELRKLRARIAATRWPDKETVTDDSQGVPSRCFRNSPATGRRGTTGKSARRN